MAEVSNEVINERLTRMQDDVREIKTTLTNSFVQKAEYAADRKSQEEKNALMQKSIEAVAGNQTKVAWIVIGSVLAAALSFVVIPRVL